MSQAQDITRPGEISVALPEGGDVANVGEAGWLQFIDPSAIPWSVLVLVGGIVVARLLEKLAESLSERSVSYRLEIKNLGTILRLLLILASAVYAALNVMVLNSQALFAFAGTLGVLVGFAVKDGLSNLLTGFSIVLGRSFQVGDRVSLAGHYGEVKTIGLMQVKIQTLDDNLVTIPARKLRDEVVSNANAGNLDCMVVMDFPLRADADHKKAMDIVREAVYVSRLVNLDRPVLVRVFIENLEGVGAFIKIRSRAYVYDTRFERWFLSDVTDRVLTAFREQKIALLQVPQYEQRGNGLSAGVQGR